MARQPEEPAEQQFGGWWTELKLNAVISYLEAYIDALKKHKFTKYYIDCFAGSGYRAEVNKDDTDEPFLLSELNEISEVKTQYRDGSARRALLLEPGFDKYIFVEKDKALLDKLQATVNADFKHHSCKFIHGKVQDVA